MIPCGQVHLVRDGDLRLHGGLSKKDRSTLPRVCRTARRDRSRSEVSTCANGKSHKSLFNNNLWQSFVADLNVSLPERQRGNDANQPTLLGVMRRSGRDLLGPESRAPGWPGLFLGKKQPREPTAKSGTDRFAGPMVFYTTRAFQGGRAWPASEPPKPPRRTKAGGRVTLASV
jgi:hypothetical protein